MALLKGNRRHTLESWNYTNKNKSGVERGIKIKERPSFDVAISYKDKNGNIQYSNSTFHSEKSLNYILKKLGVKKPITPTQSDRYSNDVALRKKKIKVTKNKGFEE